MSKLVDGKGVLIVDMDFKTFCNHYRDLKVNQKPIENLIEDTLPIISDLSFSNDHEVFYPEGIFTDEKLNLLFFTNSHINRVTILDDSLEVQTWAYNEVRSVKLIVPDRFYLRLEITLKDGQQISLDSEKDTNNTWSSKLKEKIKTIYELYMKS
ncbi:DUF3908 family protein [Metabacillus bambusae]|uniref:DUF3908 family protein n=1 Tax=Metabacillus bambusae TaxID=2795218 RepID=A0ABS3N9S1_9BACI|nr:DUF3908 family protein [Metabacillus bambusae]MBO1515040.1 DUF3908 family protein [Metabacillus bambusae]